jgi:hypothetical protein
MEYKMTDRVKHPEHYTNSNAICKTCGVKIECIDITTHMNFNLGNAVKYIWRLDLKTEDPCEDIRKAIQYLEFELKRRKPHPKPTIEPGKDAYIFGTHGSGKFNMGVNYDNE